LHFKNLAREKKFFDCFYLVEPNIFFRRELTKIKNAKVIELAVVPRALSGVPIALYKTRNRELGSLLPPRDLSGVDIWSSHAEGYKNIETAPVDSATIDEIINRIRFETGFTSLLIKIDIQGLDFAVVSDSRLIREADIVVLEVPFDSDVSLSGSPDELNLADVMKSLDKIGFRLLRIVPNGGGEANISLFSNRITLEQALEFEQLSGFSTSWILKMRPKPLSAKWRTLTRNVRNKALTLLGYR
jgi:hypothetical protein